jgi:hypothetical protein
VVYHKLASPLFSKALPMNIVKRLILRVARKLVRVAGEESVVPLEKMANAPDLFLQYRGFLRQPELARKPGGWEYKGRFYQDYLTVGGAGHAIFRTALNYCKGKGIEVGAGLWPLPGAVPLDIWRGPGAGNALADIPDTSQDYVFSSHCLEHVEDWNSELDKWVGKLKPGGIIFLYLPHPDCGIWNPGSPMVGDEHKWQPEPKVIKTALENRHCKIVEFDDGPDVMMSFFVCGQKI